MKTSLRKELLDHGRHGRRLRRSPGAPERGDRPPGPGGVHRRGPEAERGHPEPAREAPEAGGAVPEVPGVPDPCHPAGLGPKKGTFISKLYSLFNHKMAATSAGLGWIGKNGLLISTDYGPRLSLATVLTDAPLEPDAPMEHSLCGECMLCMKHCPVAGDHRLGMVAVIALCGTGAARGLQKPQDEQAAD